MKVKEGFVLRSVGKEHVVISIGKAVSVLNGIIKLNDSGVLLWNLLKDGTDKSALVTALQQEYGIDAERAEHDVGAFLATLNRVGCIE